MAEKKALSLSQILLGLLVWTALFFVACPDTALSCVGFEDYKDITSGSDNVGAEGETRQGDEYTSSMDSSSNAVDTMASLFPSPKYLIEAINNSMGVGEMSAWTNGTWFNDVFYDDGQYLSTLEYEFGPRERLTNLQNKIELTIGDKSNIGSRVGYVKISILFYVIASKSEGKAIYIDKIEKLREVLNMEIPREIYEGIATEQDVNLQFGGLDFLFEKSGASRDVFELTISQ